MGRIHFLFALLSVGSLLAVAAVTAAEQAKLTQEERHESTEPGLERNAKGPVDSWRWANISLDTLRARYPDRGDGASELGDDVEQMSLRACSAGQYGYANVFSWGTCTHESTDARQHGYLRSNGGSGEYSNHEDCSWVIKATGAQRIKIHFTSFNTESCCDFVYIYRCSSSSGAVSCGSQQELAKHSGSHPHGAWESTTGIMRVRFTSDYSVTSSGFVAYWQVEYCTACPAGKFRRQFSVLFLSLPPSLLLPRYRAQVQFPHPASADSGRDCGPCGGVIV